MDTNINADAEKYLANWKRAEADFANYRKEESRRVADLLAFGSESLIKELLDVIDNLQIALKHAPPDISAQWLDGIRQVERQFSDLLADRGVEKIETIGAAFDPAFHEPVQAVPSAEGKEGGEVIEEARAGYTMKTPAGDEKVIRPARVIISQ